MAEKIELPTTQRAYTLRLRGANPDDTTWRDALWATHEAVNKGAKAFGDWLLTLRGGLCHTLADAKVPVGKDKPDRDPTVEERRDRRILLALSWLSVEDAHGAPEEFVVENPVETLRAILGARGLTENNRGDWMKDCSNSLAARIRDDAKWVNRSAAFDSVAKQCPSLTRSEIWDFLEPFFVSPKSYLLPEKSEADTTEEIGTKDDKAKDLAQKAGGWLSRRMGSGAGADFLTMSKAYEQIAAWAKTAGEGVSGISALAELARSLSEFSPGSDDADGILSIISGPGYKSATRNQIKAIASQQTLSCDILDRLVECAGNDAALSASKVGGKGRRPYSDMIISSVEKACGFNYLQTEAAALHPEFSVMLDHAARRVNVAHSWIKNAEAERRQFEADAERLGHVPADARRWLESYCADRKQSSGGIDPYRIRRRAIDGWEQVIERWSRGDCKTPADRISAARTLQDEIEKPGDIQLFESLAADDAQCVWKSGSTTSAQPLKDFVFATDAMAKQQRFKVPAYRHPDPLRHPVFTDFGNSRWEINFSAHRTPTIAVDRNRTQLRLWTGKTVEPVTLRWSCKRLAADLALQQCGRAKGDMAIPVTRADRLGRAAAGASETSRVSITGLFDEKEWSGRLQAPRAQLDAIARHLDKDKHGWDAKAQTMVKRIRWLVSFSAKLVPQGPWSELAAKLNLKTDPQYWPHAEVNKKRQGHGRLVLSRLPGLRILSVDLGHRYAAACAVWEAITSEQIREACRIANLVAPSADAMYFHLKGKNARGQNTTTIYRRIGPDVLPDGSPHSAPWARLDRQFLVKLQGEDCPARKASPDEIREVADFEAWAGRARGSGEPPRDLAVDAMMSDGVRTARLALARHARRARIAHNLTATSRTRPGAVQQPLTDETRLELLGDTLADWHSLATDDRWSDSVARDLWNAKLASLPGGFAVQPRQAPVAGEEPSKADRKKEEESLRKRLQPVAQALAGDAALRDQLHEQWAARWNQDDGEWRKKLKWLSRWLMPRGLTRIVEVIKKDGRRIKRRKRIPEAIASASNVGGLSLTRLATLTEFRRKVQVGFFTRMRPDGARKEIGEHFGHSTLDAIEKLKDNRVKQLASRIVEAALGVGIERQSGNGYDLQRPRERINEPRFAPCHAVVIEDLSHYRPEETRTRRENRATMDWKSAEARKRLEDACQLHGLHLRDVNPQYTSRQDSRTGAPGARGIEVNVKAFLSSLMWRKQVAQADRKRLEGKGDARDRMLVDLAARYKGATGSKLNERLRIPLKGGDLFFSSDPQSPAANGLQADLNAAANIGLRALMDPDFTGKWWYVPCDPKTQTAKPEKVKGGLLDGIGPLAPAPAGNENQTKKAAKASKGKPREVVNLWRNPSTAPIRGADHGDLWLDTGSYWNRVRMAVVKVLGGLMSEPELAPQEVPF